MRLIIIIGMLACAAMAQDCKNPLLTMASPEYISSGVLDAPILGKDIKYCTGLNGKQVCCKEKGFTNIEKLFTERQGYLILYNK